MTSFPRQKYVGLAEGKGYDGNKAADYLVNNPDYFAGTAIGQALPNTGQITNP
jgi:hypothetical protein